MTNSWKLRLLWVMDSDKFGSSHNSNGRKARSKHKDIDRRIKRREHARITQEALAEYEQDCLEKEAFFESLYDDYEEDFSEMDWHESMDDMQPTMDDLYEYEPIDWYFDDGPDFVSEYKRANENHYRTITQEDVGMTLAEVLERSMK